MLYFIFKGSVYNAEALYESVLTNMPPNRKHKYYPPYFYTNNRLLCSAEMNTIDAPTYTHYYNTTYKHTLHDPFCSCNACVSSRYVTL